MQGRRLPDATGLNREAFEPGDYQKVVFKKGIYWYVCPPRGRVGHISDHTVVENEDGTITVTPSILLPEWHGYLTAGEWREV